MSFCITSAIPRDCNENCAGGIGRIFIAPADAIDAVTLAVDGKVDAITVLSGGQFFEYEPYQETGNFTETLAREQGNTAVTSTILGVFICRSQEKRNAIMDLASCTCGLVVVWEEASGKRFIMGLEQRQNVDLPFGRAAQLTAGEGTTGTAIGDNNQESITIEAISAAKARELDASVTLPLTPVP